MLENCMPIRVATQACR